MQIADIRRAVADAYGMTEGELLTPCHKRAVARPRQIGMYLAWEMGSKSLGQIAQQFRRDRKTVWFGIKQIEGMRHRPEIASAIVNVLGRLPA